MRRSWAPWLLGFGLLSCKHGDPENPPLPEDAGTEATDAGPADSGAPDSGTFTLPPDRAHNASVYYEIFVRSFADSDGDGVGDFVGLTQKLDYLNDGDPNTTTDLGINGIWLMPIHPSPSYHGYDVTDYRNVNPAYGTMADFEAFLAAAEARGIKVIIDLVLNHSATAHPWFEAAKSGPSDPRRSWYHFRADDPGWTQPWGPGKVWHRLPDGSAYYYGIFWSGMPDLNLGNPDVEAEMASMMRFWLDKGVAGFRVDAARHLFESPAGQISDQPESHTFIKRLRPQLLGPHPDAFLVAEAWTNLSTVASYYGQADEFDLAFGFDTGAAIRTAIKDGVRADFVQVLSAAERNYLDRRFEAPFLTNHDMARVMADLGNDPSAMRLAAATLFALPGTPFLYYGEELGMVGGPTPADEDKRTPMRWDAAGPNFGFTTGTPWRRAPEAAGVDVATQSADPNSLLNLYRQLIRLRLAHPALSTGGATRPGSSGGGPGTAAILRTKDNQRILYVVNFRNEAATELTIEVEGTPRALASEGVAAPRKEGARLIFPTLGPRSYAYYALE